MEELQLPSIPILLSSLFLLIFIIKRGFTAKSKSQQYPKLPPGPWKLPVIGNMHKLVGQLPFRAYRDLARKHGPLMLLKIGQIDLAIASSPEGAEEILKKQDLNFAFRPLTSAVKAIAYGGSDIGFSPYGPYWKQLRKLCFMELLSTKRIRSYSAVRMEEILNLMAYISETRTPINLSEKLSTMSNNIVARAAFGKRNKHQEGFIQLSKDAQEIAARFSFTDTLPSLKFLDVLTGNTFRISTIRRRLDDILEEIIKEHQDKPRTNQGRQADEVEDLVDVLLRFKDDPELEIPMTMDNVKAVILDMFTGGTETSSTMIEWALAELVRHPETLAKAQKEVREAFKGKTRVEESDVAELSYLKLVVKETLRLHTPVPTLIPRVCKETCEVLGYRVEAGTWVFVNAWAISRDPQYWPDAENFKPERFEGSSLDFKGMNFEYLPFGAGRRICPGMGFGLATVDLALAQLLFYFDWKLPGGMKPEELDMTESFSSTVGRKTELKLLAVPLFPVPAAV